MFKKIALAVLIIIVVFFVAPHPRIHLSDSFCYCILGTKCGRCPRKGDIEWRTPLIFGLGDLIRQVISGKKVYLKMTEVKLK